MREKPHSIKSPRHNSGWVLAREKDLARATAINALLTSPIAVLPMKVGDPIRPFAHGIWRDIRPFLRPENSVSSLRKAISTYVYSRSYQVALARPHSIRHDVSGAPADFVSDSERLDAQQKYASLRTSGPFDKMSPSSAARPRRDTEE